MRVIAFILIWLCLALPGFGQEKSFGPIALNCYWFFNGDEGKVTIDKPRSTLEYSTKAGHLTGLLLSEAPLASCESTEQMVEARNCLESCPHFA